MFPNLSKAVINAVRGFVVFGLAGVALSLSACSTVPAKSSRQGLLDQGEKRSGVKLFGKSKGDTYSPKSFGEVKLPGKWQWPLENIEISSSYGERGHKFHQGVDLRAHVGTPVFAASDGEVVYVGSKIRGYGRMVVLKHADGFYTVYAHHSKNLVKIGRKVEAGQKIALSGKSGRASGAHLHFELRRGAQSIDPEYAFNGHLKSAANRRIASKSKVKFHYEE
jgi:murein DD-endopeptidase MepM/ murein hydrolase activator NlpD